MPAAFEIGRTARYTGGGAASLGGDSGPVGSSGLTRQAMYGILLYDGVEPIDVGAAFGVLSIAKRLVPELAFVGVARAPGPVRCANGLTVLSDHGFADCPALDDLVVTGGPGWSAAAQDPDTVAFVRDRPGRVASMCTGAMILDAAGRLEGRAATTKQAVFDGETPPIELLSAGVRRTAAAVVEDGDVLTSGGVTLGIDAMFRLLARSHGQAVADETARVMEYSRALEANRAAFANA